MSKNTVKQCALCGKSIVLKTISQKGYKAPELFSIYYCPHCNTSFSMPRVEGSDIYELIYQNANNVPGYDRYCEYAKKIVLQDNPLKWLANLEPIYWGPYSVIVNKLLLNKDAKILEIGSGLGYFTYALRKAGFYNAWGLDISQEAVEKAKMNFGDFYLCADLHQYTKGNRDCYDLIISTEVIEHIDAPIDFLHSMSLLIKDTGHIILTTPNKSFYPNNAIWITDLPPVHCWWFSENSIKYMAERLNLDFLFVDYTDFYKTHTPHLFDTKQCESLADNFIFDEVGNLIKTGNHTKNMGLFPLWIKKTSIYKKLSRKLWPLLFDHFISSKCRTVDLCVVLSKNKSKECEQ